MMLDEFKRLVDDLVILATRHQGILENIKYQDGKIGFDYKMDEKGFHITLTVASDHVVNSPNVSVVEATDLPFSKKPEKDGDL